MNAIKVSDEKKTFEKYQMTVKEKNKCAEKVFSLNLNAPYKRFVLFTIF